MKYVLTLFLCLLSAALYAQDKGATGLPVPRFVSLKAGQANLRTGPGAEYPIKWVYQRKSLPLKVVKDYYNWRKIEDYEGETGWFHVSLLSGKRTAMIQKGRHRLFSKPDPRSRHVLTVEAGVIGDLLDCQESWCRVKINGRKAWIERRFLYGVFAGVSY